MQIVNQSISPDLIAIFENSIKFFQEWRVFSDPVWLPAISFSG